MSTKPEEMQSVVVKSEEMQPEVQPEMQLPVSDVKPKRFALKPRKRSALKPIQQKRSASEQMMLPDPKQLLRWQNILDTNYVILRDNLKPSPLVKFLALSSDQQKTLDGMVDEHQRTDYLLKQVLPNGSKGLLNQFKEGLKATDQSHLIAYLPEPKRKMSEGGKEVKRSRSDKEESSEGGELPMMVHINELKYVKLMKHREQLMVNLREYIKDCDGKLHPTKKGIMLSMKDWQCFKKEMKYLDKLLKVLKISAADK